MFGTTPTTTPLRSASHLFSALSAYRLRPTPCASKHSFRLSVSQSRILGQQDAATLIEFALLLPVLFSIMFGVTIASDVLQTKSQNLNLNRELGNYAMRNCRTTQDEPTTMENEVDACLSEAKDIVANLSGNSALQYGALITTYDCLTLTCTDANDLSCLAQDAGCSCTCTEVVQTGTTEATPPPSSQRPGELPANPPVSEPHTLIRSNGTPLPPRTNPDAYATVGAHHITQNRRDSSHGTGGRPSEGAVPVVVVSRFNVGTITSTPELVELFRYRQRIFITETRLRFSQLNSTGLEPSAYDVSIF